MIGAVIEAAVIIATVPEPWMKRMIVAIRNGRRIAGRLVSTMASAMTVPTPLSRISMPNAPPPPVMRMMIPAERMPFSISSRTRLRGRLLVSP